MTTLRRVGGRTASLLLVAVASLALASCGAGSPDPADPDAAPTGMPSADATSGPANPDAQPTCDTIIPESLVSDFEGYGMSSQEEPFLVGPDQELEGGIQCTWGNLDVATDDVQIYGWAPIDAQRAAELQAYLEEQGWVREEADGYVYVSEDPELAMHVDDDGYGMTYAFGEDHVLLADTKQGITLVTWR
ncbi:hypothetical protein [Microbacterium marinilacus]|uniref:Uncharacterized protein n=1 Tax=Microbacterium marinilacus TaxID=415209 RepID=A0ABP7B6R9_9MICO|nr:hypothetical protein [Microbacterium marinilacus]MBY0687547.1 hypothetical protein [Microbacterium marinilacus]